MVFDSNQRFHLRTEMFMNQQSLPLSGIRVIEFSHMVMGPSCGLVLADLGAEVIKVEPPENRTNPATRRGI